MKKKATLFLLLLILAMLAVASFGCVMRIETSAFWSAPGYYATEYAPPPVIIRYGDGSYGYGRPVVIRYAPYPSSARPVPGWKK